jgi:hypothetical protein
LHLGGVPLAGACALAPHVRTLEPESDCGTLARHAPEIPVHRPDDEISPCAGRFRSEPPTPGPPAAVRMGGVSESGMGILAWRVVCETQAVAARWPAGVPAAAPRCTGRALSH